MDSATKTKCEPDEKKNGENKIQNTSYNNSIFHINKDMWRFKLHFFLFIGGIAAAFPYIPDYAKNRIGISTTALAVILMVQQFLFIVTKPLIGYLADYFNKLKALICILTIVQGVCFFLILIIPKFKYTGVENNTYSLLTPCLSDEKNTTSVTSLSSDSAIISQKIQFHNDTVKIVRDLLTNRSELYQLKECYASDISSFVSEELTTIERKENVVEDSQFCRLQLVEAQELNCQPCPSGETVVYENICACHFAKKNCLCLLINPNTSSVQELNSTSTPMQCICIEKNGFYGSFPITFPQNSNFALGEGHNGEFKSYQFWLFAFVHTLGMVCNNAVFTLSDTACCESVERAGSDFGRQRLWGAFGWGLIAPIGGLLNDYTGNYLSAWIIMGVCLSIAVWNVSNLELTKPHFSQNILGDVGTVLKSGEFLLFEAGLLMNGIGAAMIWYYLILFLISIGASKLLCGLSLTVQSFLGTIPLMFFSERIIKKLGHLNVVSLALLLYTVRFLWYSFLYKPWLVLLVEYLHGFTYGLLYANIASFGKTSARPGTEATTQSVLFCTHEGLGAGLGCVLGGLGLDHLGGRQTFFIASLFTGCGLIFHQLSALLIRRRKGIMKVTTAAA